jgi:hypothetical protein
MPTSTPQYLEYSLSCVNAHFRESKTARRWKPVNALSPVRIAYGRKGISGSVARRLLQSTIAVKLESLSFARESVLRPQFGNHGLNDREQNA